MPSPGANFRLCRPWFVILYALVRFLLLLLSESDPLSTLYYSMLQQQDRPWSTTVDRTMQRLMHTRPHAPMTLVDRPTRKDAHAWSWSVARAIRRQHVTRITVTKITVTNQLSDVTSRFIHFWIQFYEIPDSDSREFAILNILSSATRGTHSKHSRMPYWNIFLLQSIWSAHWWELMNWLLLMIGLRG